MDDNQQSYNRQPSVVSYNQIVKKLLETVMTVSVLNVRNEVWRIRYAFSILIDQMWIFVKKIFLNYALELFLLGRTSKKTKTMNTKRQQPTFPPPSLSLSFSHSENKVIIMVLNIVNNISVNVGSLFVISILQYIHYSHFFFSDFYYWMLFMKVSRFILRLRMAVIPAPNTQCNHFFLCDMNA